MIRQRWQHLLARYDALSRRERGLVAAAVVGGVLLIGNALFIDLPLARASVQTRQMAAERNELATLQAQLASLQRDLRDPNEENRQRLAAIGNEMQGLRAELLRHEQQLVPPREIPGLLERLLTRHAALRLVSLKTLPGRLANAPEDSAAAAPSGEPAARGKGTIEVWRHGVEIRLRGSYADLSDYVADLESLPQRLVWGEATLSADYPKSELQLKLYSYSLDRAWLSL